MVFQHQSVRTSTYFYIRFTLTMGRSPGFGSTTSNYSPYSDSLSLWLQGTIPLTSLLVVTRRLILQQARSQAFKTETLHSPPTACGHTVSGSISLPSRGSISPFPHGTISLSVAREYLALGDGPPRFLQDFSCPVVLGLDTQRDISLSVTGLSPSIVSLSMLFT